MYVFAGAKGGEAEKKITSSPGKANILLHLYGALLMQDV